MSLTALNKSSQLDVALSEINEHYGALRFIWPAAEIYRPPLKGVEYRRFSFLVTTMLPA